MSFFFLFFFFFYLLRSINSLTTIDLLLSQGKSPPTPKKSKKGKGRAETSSTSQGSTQPSSPQVRNAPTPATISSSAAHEDVFIRDVPPHQSYRFAEEEDDSDCDDIYVPFSGMKISHINDDFAPEEMGYADVNNTGERGDVANAVAVPVEEEVREYQNLWLSEDDPRAIPLPAVICPVHNIACKKGICEDMAKILREKKKAELREIWEKQKKNKGTRFVSSFF